MDLLPTPEQDEIVSSVGAFLTAKLPMTRLRELQAEGAPVDDAVWRQCASLGWFGLGLDEAAGGVGYGLAEEALVFREIGRHLAPGPFLATVLAARVASRPQRDAILDGATRVALVDVRDATVTPDGVTGTVLLYDHPTAELGIVLVPAGAALVELTGFTELTPSPCLDPSTSVATARADELRPVAYVAAAADPVFTRGAVLAAAMASGIAEATRDLSAEHARSRVQFGRPIGVNQAIKHACTDMAVRAEAAATQTFFAAMTLDSQRPDAAFQASSAKLVATDAALENARTTIQVHGGLGFTWEHDAHLHLKRAHVLDQILGSRHYHLATLIDLPPAQ
jgi:alkylation response protein AidB-like acyl-CoA dehydrogenase